MNHATLGPGLLATTGKLSSRITTCPCSLYLYRIGDEHRRQRKLLNPAFNINHMREMIPVFYEVTHRVSFPQRSASRRTLMLSNSYDRRSRIAWRMAQRRLIWSIGWVVQHSNSWVKRVSVTPLTLLSKLARILTELR